MRFCALKNWLRLLFPLIFPLLLLYSFIITISRSSPSSSAICFSAEVNKLGNARGRLALKKTGDFIDYSFFSKSDWKKKDFSFCAAFSFASPRESPRSTTSPKFSTTFFFFFLQRDLEFLYDHLFVPNLEICPISEIMKSYASFWTAGAWTFLRYVLLTYSTFSVCSRVILSSDFI